MIILLVILDLHVFGIEAKPSNKAMLTINGFQKGESGGGASKCDGKFHSDKSKIVALSTRWYNGGSRCHHLIKITAKNGRSVEAMVVDECDSHRGCAKNIVDASEAVWKGLGVKKHDWGLMEVTWSDV
ncbi:hypothetical protein Leryth_027415 [Lithospermum erythrorhizon]|nr:hypothetical protein Leryth_027415 [Lithospermum erythrorhizon]